MKQSNTKKPKLTEPMAPKVVRGEIDYFTNLYVKIKFKIIHFKMFNV